MWNFILSILFTICLSQPTFQGELSLCEGFQAEEGVSFNPYPGDCTQFVQCWLEGNRVNASVSRCPFGQFWDPDAVTCRPSINVQCSDNPCRQSANSLTYRMEGYGCRAHWECLEGLSFGRCCPEGSAYVEGTGCQESSTCEDECPPNEYIVPPSTTACNKKPHLESRYYIEMVDGQGEITRPCPDGTIFIEESCACDFDPASLAANQPESNPQGSNGS